MHNSLTVDMCVDIRKDCPIDYLITADNQAEFSFGGPKGGCHYAFDAAALRAFLKLGVEALAEIDGRTEQGQSADCTTRALVTTGGQSVAR
jgi:hypothetical protein